MIVWVVMVYIFLAVVGLALGSFVNALVWRLHQQLGARSQEPGAGGRKAESNRLSILYGRSICTNCGHKLAAKDLIPIFSWLALRGKCRSCKKPISPQYPLVELITAALFVISYIFWPAFQGPSLETMDIAGFIVWLILLVGLISLAVYDLRWMLLPNRIIFPLLGLAAASVFLEAVLTTNHQPLITGFFGAAVGGGLFYLLFQLSGGKWIGGGDVKLGFLLGLVLGDARPAFLMLFLASALGALVSIPMLVSGGAKRSTRIPFGPFLIAAVIIVKLFGQGIIDWYMNMYIV